ncbi:MAG: carboxypeptidase regulatory-like domain-containing protein, partial [Chitinophagaceae bacterium]
MRKALVIVFLVFNSLQLFAQSTTGSIWGRITDSLQQPLEGVSVMLISNANNITVKSALSDDKGAFVLENIKPGSYKVVISMTGFRQYSDSSLIVNKETMNVDLGFIKLL